MQDQLKDNVTPGSKWAFDEAVTAAFEDMLARSIPEYHAMRDLVFRTGCHFVQPGTAIVDLGCSRGAALAPFVNRFGAENTYIGVEISPSMIGAARERFEQSVYSEQVSIEEIDLRHAYPAVNASLTLCVLTLQFTPIEHRHRILKRIFDTVTPGGALILVEKVLGYTYPSDGLLTSVYYEMKATNGYSEEQIAAKRISLEGVLVPITARWNEEILSAAGFRHVECFWRNLNFAAWVAIKE